MVLPNYKIEIAFDSGFSTPAASRTWTDVSAYVEGDQPLTISRGRADELGQIDASRLTLTLDNSDGRFTPEKASGAYYPNVKKGRPIRVTATVGEPPVEYIRFVGYIDEWPVSWPDAVDGRSLVTITATSRMARLGRAAELRSVPEEELYATSSPSLYYKLNEAAGATLASDSAGVVDNGTAVVEVNLGGSVTFAQDTGAAGDGYAAPRFSTSSATASQVARLVARNHGLALNLREVCFSGFINIHNTTADVDILTVGAQPQGTSDRMAGAKLNVSSGAVQYIFEGGGSTFGSVFTVTGLIQANTTHHVALVQDGAGTAEIWVDGVMKASTVPGYVPSIPLSGPPVALGTVSTPTAAARDITISHAAIGALFIPWATRGTAVPAIAESGLTGFADEPLTDRVERYAGYAGIPAVEVNATQARATAVAAFDVAGSTPLEMIRRLAATNDGVVYDAREGLLAYRDGASRYNASSTFTLSATAQEVEADIEPRLDDQFLINDFTAAGLLGLEARVFDQDSLDDYGIYRQTADMLTGNTLALEAMAQWRVGLGKQPRLRYATVTVDITNATDAVAHAVAPADIGWRFGLSDLPTQAPSSTADLFIEGYTETLTATGHSITFNASPTYGYAGTVGVWQLDVNTLDGPNILAL